MPITSAADDSFAFALTTAARLIRARFETALREAALDVTPAEARALSMADRLGRPNQTELAAALSIEPMSLVNLLDRLEKQGLVERQSDPNDRRTKLISLTGKAGPELKKIRKVFEASRKEAARNFSAGELAQLHALLQRLCQDLSVSGGE